jgi:mycofactocin system glycosyltransferase
MGGSPLRLWRLTPKARALLDGWRTGAPVGRSTAARLLARRLVSSGAFVPQPGQGALTESDVTVVVPVHDRPAQLDRLLHALGSLSCIVVDDGSRDAALTEEIATRHGARCIALPHNEGPAAARNRGLAAVTSPVVAFIDSDVVPTQGWLDPLLALFDDPLVAAVAPRVIPNPPARRTSLSAYEAVRSALDRGGRGGVVRPQSRIPFVPSATLLVRRAAVGDHPFDEDLRTGEDVDLVWRLDAQGWDVRFDPTSTMLHDGPSDGRAFLTQRLAYGMSAAPLAARHPEVMAPLRSSVWSAATWCLLATRRPVAAAAVLATAVLVLARRLGRHVHDPVGVAGRIAGGGTVDGALPALSGLARAWAPAVALGLLSRRTRRAAVAAFLLPACKDAFAEPTGLSRVRYLAWHVADDLAYGTGVWIGCIKDRNLVPLTPRLEWRARVWSTDALRTQLRADGAPPEATAARA